MRVHLPRIGTDEHVDLIVDDFERLAAADRFGEHELVSDPAAADIVLFTQCHGVDWRLHAIRDHPAARAFWDKVMVYDERDRPWRSFPGVYVSVPAPAFDHRSQRACAYAGVTDLHDSSNEPDLLFSFVGSASAPCRTPLFRLRHADAVIEEVQGFMFWDAEAPEFESRRRAYLATLMRSRFVLCPRGRGTSTFRLYETLSAGRVPVIISDNWVPPRGPDWSSCSLRWPEGTTDGLVEMLLARNREWQAMSFAASEVSACYFGRASAFHRILSACREIEASRSSPESPRHLAARSVAASIRERLGPVC
jgi:Exostosin family